MVEEKMKEIINSWNSAVKHKKSSPRQTTSNLTSSAHRYVHGVSVLYFLLQGPIYTEICFVDIKIKICEQIICILSYIE